MAHIKRIDFAHVGRKEGCLCDKCGQYIQNIVTVEYDFGTVHYGQDCFAKMYNNSTLTSYGVKLLKKTMKSIEHWSRELAKYTSGEMTAETDLSYKYCQPNEYGYCDKSYWTGKPYEEYREWMINEWFPARFEECQKEIDRFKKVNFEA